MRSTDTIVQRRTNAPPAPGDASRNIADIEVSDPKQFAQLYRWLADSCLSELEISAEGVEAGIGGKVHANSKTGTARRARVTVMYLLLRKMTGGVIGAGRAAWDYLSVKQIMLYTGYTRRHVQRALRELECLGVVRTRLLDNAPSVYEVIESGLKTLAERGKKRVIDTLRTLRSSRVLAVLGGTKTEQKERQTDEESESFVDVYDRVFGAGAAKHSNLTERSARRLCKARGIDVFTWKDECEKVALAFNKARHSVATVVRESPHLLVHRAKWAVMVRLGEGLATT